MGLFRSLLLAMILGLPLASSAWSAELVMYRRAGCPWCAAWDREIAPIYGKTEIGRRAPIRFVDLDHDSSQVIVLVSPIRYTPTFILVEGGREVGRIEGYPGEEFFWGHMDQLVKRLPLRGNLPGQTRMHPGPGEIVEQIS